MSAGEIRKELAKFKGWGLLLTVVAFFILLTGLELLTAGMTLNWRSAGGAIVAVMGTILIRMAWRQNKFDKLLNEYWAKWRKIAWTKDELASKIGFVIPYGVVRITWVERFAYEFIRAKGVGPYAPIDIFSFCHNSSLFEIRQGMRYGALALVGHQCLVLNSKEEYEWSDEIREKYFELNRMPDEFKPMQKTVDGGVFHSEPFAGIPDGFH